MKVSEKDIQKAILDYLKMRGYLCRRTNAGMARYTYKGKEKFFKVGEAGWPDIEGILKDGSGRYFGIEVKAAGGELRPSQIEVGKMILGSNGIWFVARSVDEVISRGF